MLNSSRSMKYYFLYYPFKQWAARGDKCMCGFGLYDFKAKWLTKFIFLIIIKVMKMIC